MNTIDSLARHTLDTLPLNVAVIDEEGTILLTNRAWDEFAGVGPTGDEMVGVNYIEATDTEADQDAAAAVEGLQEVIDGERDLFTLEYPCHSPDERRWFLMRATSLPPDADGSVVVAHVDITARKLAELETERRGRELEHLVGRLQGLVGDVMEAVLRSTDRADIERTVVEQLAGVEDYAFAWVGRVDLRREAIVPAAAADDATLPEDAAVPLDADDPVALALDRHEPELCRDRAEVVLDDVHDAVFDELGIGSGGAMSAFPLVYGSTEYGVLVLYARAADALDERELAVIQVLSRVASTAINAAEGRRILATDSVVELEVTLRAPGLFFADLSADLDCVLEYEGTLYGSGEADAAESRTGADGDTPVSRTGADGDTVASRTGADADAGATMLFVASDVDPEALLTAARAHEGVADARLVSTGDDAAVLEVRVAAPPLVEHVAERGAETTAFRVEDGLVRATFELPAGAEPRGLVEALEDRYESVSLAARRERERREQTRSELLDDIEGALTDRQRLALEKAHVGGFFDWPREVSGEDLAASMDISPSTYHQHLRAAERKVLDALFGH